MQVQSNMYAQHTVQSEVVRRDINRHHCTCNELRPLARVGALGNAPARSMRSSSSCVRRRKKVCMSASACAFMASSCSLAIFFSRRCTNDSHDASDTPTDIVRTFVHDCHSTTNGAYGGDAQPVASVGVNSYVCRRCNVSQRRAQQAFTAQVETLRDTPDRLCLSLP